MMIPMLKVFWELVTNTPLTVYSVVLGNVFSVSRDELYGLLDCFKKKKKRK